MSGSAPNGARSGPPSIDRLRESTTRFRFICSRCRIASIPYTNIGITIPVDESGGVRLVHSAGSPPCDGEVWVQARIIGWRDGSRDDVWITFVSPDLLLTAGESVSTVRRRVTEFMATQEGS